MYLVLSMMNGKVRIDRPTDTQDAAGAVIRTYRTYAQYVPVCITQDAGSRGNQDGGPRDIASGRCIFLPGTDIRRQDRIVWNGRTLEVQQVNAQYANEDSTVTQIITTWQEQYEADASGSTGDTIQITEPPG